MPTIADSLQNAAQAVTDQGEAYKLAAAILNNEIGNVALDAGLVPTESIGTRILRAIRSGLLWSVTDTSTTPGRISVAMRTPPTGYTVGMPLTVRLAQDIAGATVININGIGERAVRQFGGADLVRGDYRKGDLIQLVGYADAGGTFAGFYVTTPVSGVIIDTPVTKTVHGAGADFPDLNAALAWLGRRRIALTGAVAFLLAAGVNADKLVYTSNITFQHPDGVRVAILGQPMKGAGPTGPSLSFTGTSPAQQATDTGTNLTLLRAAYATEIGFANGAGFRGLGSIGNVQDVLMTSDRAGGSDIFVWAAGNATLTRCAAVNSGGRGYALSSVYLTVVGANYALGCASFGFAAEGATTVVGGAAHALIASSNASAGISGVQSTLTTPGSSLLIYARGNGGDGIGILGGRLGASPASVSRDNVGVGFNVLDTGTANVTGTTASGNATGYQAGNGARMDAYGTSGSNRDYGYVAVNGANLSRATGTATGGVAAASPAVGSTGNNNGYIS